MIRAGQKVVCVDDSATSTYGTRDLKQGQTYTVRWSGDAVHPEIGRYDGVLLEEFDRGCDPIMGVKVPFSAARFVLVQPCL